MEDISANYRQDWMLEMESPDISIIVPIYKVEQYINECINSLLVQTYRDTEIILVDDGTPDSCGIRCDGYALSDPKITVIHQQNAGLSCARNIGIPLSKGKYLCFIDSDDSVAPIYCETLYYLLDGTAYDFSVCGVWRYQDGTSITKTEGDPEIKVVSNEEYLRLQLTKQSEFGVWNKLYRKELFEQIKFMPEKIHEDVIWSADLAGILNNGVILTSAKLYYYRQRDTGIVAAGNQKCHPDRVFAGEYLTKTVQEKYPSLEAFVLKYAINYPWMFVDKIYLKHSFTENKQFILQLQCYLRKYFHRMKSNRVFDSVILHRMSIFSRSRIIYGMDVYVRLFEDIVHKKILRIDP